MTERDPSDATVVSAPDSPPGRAPASSEPIYREIARTLAAAIEDGRYPPGTRLPAETTLARQLGVSRGTLREALDLLRREGRIESVRARGNFVRSPTARKPSERRRVVGVLVPSVAKPYVNELLAGIEDALHDRGYSMIVGSSGSTRAQQAGRVDRILAEGASGLIAYPIDYEPDPELFKRLAGDGLPIVLVDRHLVGYDFDAVLPDNVGGAFAAVSHLVELGHRRIAFVATDNLATTSVAERLQGYQQALLVAGIELDPQLVFTRLPVPRAWPRDWRAPARDNIVAIARFLSRAEASAVFALHDHLAIEVIEAARSLGLDVPADLSVAGFDDDPLAEAFSVPLTTVAQPRERIGRIAATLVVDRIEGRRQDIERIILPTRLVVRRSTARPRPALTRVATS
jgi:GntR family transcriptional regulator of arabinose operon